MMVVIFMFLRIEESELMNLCRSTLPIEAARFRLISSPIPRALVLCQVNNRLHYQPSHK
jgi:hypothetical protein